MAVSKKSKTVSYWCDQIAVYEKEFSKWGERSKKIVKRYKDERNDNQNSVARFNILWSNVQTLAPALYAKNPIPNVDRRFEDDDKVGTTAARVLERSVTYFVDKDIFGNVMRQAVLDRLLPGRGTAWVRYKFNDESGQAELTDDTQKGSDSEIPENYTEDTVVDYVHWQDFGHSWGRTWEEVPAVWRKVYMGRKALKARFKNGDKVPLDKTEKNGEDKVSEKKATIYEIWDKETLKAYWISKNMDDILDERDDPLGLSDFFPCPKPIFATLGNDNLIPTPDYIQYQDQAQELDDLTGRINEIQKALKVVGVYDKSAEGLSRLLSEGLQNTMVPVEQWAVFGEKGGLKGAVDWFPMEMIATVLIQLYDARERVKQDLYEITGISDIIRGATDPNETLGAQQLKGQYATLRLDDKQGDVARFSRDLVRMMAEIISEHFSIETIKQISGIKLLSAPEKQQIMAQQQQAQAQAQQTGQPPQPLPEEIQELLDQPTWEEVEKLLRDDTLRCFRISIETDSTIKADQEQEKQQRMELIGAVGGFLQQAVLLPPQLQPLAAELLMFGVRGFKVSREIETTFDLTMKKIKQASDAPPQPDPEQQKVQMEAEKAKGEMALKEKEIGIDEQRLTLEAQDLQLRQKEMENSHERETMKLKNDDRKTRIDGKTKVSPEVAMNDPDMNEGQITPIQQGFQELAQLMQQGFQGLAQQNAQLMQAILAPKKTQVIRGADGKITGGVSSIDTGTMQ
jgi:hypothetical protein